MSELGKKNQFDAETCGIQIYGDKTWLHSADTVKFTFGYEMGADEARQHGAGPTVSGWTVWARACGQGFRESPRNLFISHKKAPAEAGEAWQVSYMHMAGLVYPKPCLASSCPLDRSQPTAA